MAAVPPGHVAALAAKGAASPARGEAASLPAAHHRGVAGFAVALAVAAAISAGGGHA